MTLRLSSHRASARQASSLYLAQVDACLPQGAPVLGIDANRGLFCFDPFTLYSLGVLTNPNVLVLGQVGTGKSTIAKLLCWTQSHLLGSSVCVLDPKGEYAALAGACGLEHVALGPGGASRIDPFAAGDRSGESSAQFDAVCCFASACLHRALRPAEQAALGVSLGQASSLGVTTVVEGLLDPTESMSRELRIGREELRGECRELALSLRRVVAGDMAGIFGEGVTTTLEDAAAGVVVDLSSIYRNEALLPPVMVAAGAWIARHLADSSRRHVLVIDEAWSVLSNPGIGRWLRSTMKLARALGACVVLVTHSLSDFEAVGEVGSEEARISRSLLSDISTTVLLAQPEAALSEVGSALGLSETELEVVSRLRRGQGLWRIGAFHSRVVSHAIPGGLEALFDTDAAMGQGA